MTKTTTEFLDGITPEQAFKLELIARNQTVSPTTDSVEVADIHIPTPQLSLEDYVQAVMEFYSQGMDDIPEEDHNDYTEVVIQWTTFMGLRSGFVKASQAKFADVWGLTRGQVKALVERCERVLRDYKQSTFLDAKRQKQHRIFDVVIIESLALFRAYLLDPARSSD